MELSDFKIFKSFYECRNLTEVAERNNISQSTVSYRLKKMEDELGVKLYRFNGKYYFSENGIRFYEFCTNSIGEYDSFLDKLEHKSELHISLSSVATMYYMEVVYDMLKDEGYYPVISTTSSSESIRNVADGKSIFAVVGGVSNTRLPSQLEKQRIKHEEIVLIYNSSLTDDIEYIPVLLDDRQSGLNPLAVEYLKTLDDFRIVGEIGKPFDKLALAAHYPLGIFIPGEYRKYVNNTYNDRIRISRKYSFHRDLFVVYEKKHYVELIDKFIEKMNKSTIST